jgi:DNA polymerase-3 subunit gamma/tau
MSQNKLLHVELCLMKLASFGSAQVEKKKSRQIVSAKDSKINPSSDNTKVDSVEKKMSNEETTTVVCEPSSTPEKKETQNKTIEEQPQQESKDKSEHEKKSAKNKSLPQKKNGLSLKSIQYKKNHDKKLNENEKTKEVLDEDFSLEELKSAWIKFSEIIDKKGEKLLASTLLSDIPKLNGKTIELTMPNETMKIELIHNKSRILNYLSNTLKNNRLDLKIKVSASKEKKYIHTSQEKYRHFVELNPKIEELKRKLDLDF